MKELEFNILRTMAEKNIIGLPKEYEDIQEFQLAHEKLIRDGYADSTGLTDSGQD